MRPVQRGLIGLGLDPGPVGGLWDPKTKKHRRLRPLPMPLRPPPALSTLRMNYQGTAKRPVREIVVHFSDTARLVSGPLGAGEARQEIRR